LRRQHRRHHEWAREEDVAHNAVETVQNSYLDSGIQVFINICLQAGCFSPWGYKHPLSRALHNLMVIYLLCEAHSGYDLPFMSHRLFPGVFGGPVRHEEHHQRNDCYYHQFFCYLDDAFGFVPRDAPRRDRAAALLDEGQAVESKESAVSAPKACSNGAPLEVTRDPAPLALLDGGMIDAESDVARNVLSSRGEIPPASGCESPLPHRGPD
jgi:sterol desaturase/sphingolipid hydroxylase (fatty acid hydroxylase superfamily)